MFVLTPCRKRDLMEGLLGEFFPTDFPRFIDMAIKADVKENEKEILIEAELPGFEKDEVSVQLKDNSLTISAEKNLEKCEENEHYICRERKQGRVSRSFSAEDIAEDEVKADYKNGILLVTLPKLKRSNPEGYRIQIN